MIMIEEFISNLIILSKDFFTLLLDCLLKLVPQWPSITFLIILVFRKQIIELFNKVNKIKFKELELFLQNPNIPNESKILVTKDYVETESSAAGFFCRGTRKAPTITGDGSLFQIPFERCDLDAKNGVYTATQDGIYFLSWYLLFEGITDQKVVTVEIDTSNENFKFKHPDINSLKSADGNLTLNGNISVNMDSGDTAKLKVRIGANTNLKTVTLSQSQASFFSGFLFKPE